MPTLRRYLTGRFVAAFAASLFTLIGVVLVVDMLLHVDEVFDPSRGPGAVVGLLVMRTFSRYLPYLLPVAAFTGTFLAVGLAARSYEMLAIKAAGISPLRALAPIFLGALLLSGLALLVTETVSVRASAALLRSEAGGEDDFYRRSGQVWYHAGRFIYNIRSPQAEGERLEDLRLFERNDAGRVMRLIEAERGERVGPGRWRFEDGSVRTFDPAAPEDAPVFERFAEKEIEIAEDRSGRLVQGNLAAVPVWDLARYEPTPREAPRIRAVLHRRLSAPLMVLVFALIAVPLGLRAERARSLALPAAQGVLILFLFLTVREYGTTFASSGALSAALVTWLTLALFLGFGLWRLARAQR